MHALTVAVGFFIACCGVIGEQPSSVCQLLAQLRENNGKIVIVRAEAEEHEEALYLDGKSCPNEFVTDALVWPKAIVLVPPG